MDFYTPSPADIAQRSLADRPAHRSGPELLDPSNNRIRQYVPSPEHEVSFSGFLDVLSEHREIFLSVFLAVLVLGGVYIFGTPKKYASTMELLVTNERTVPAISPGKTESSGGVQEVTEEQLNSEAEVLKSADVLDAVVDPTWRLNPKARSPEELSRHEKAVNTLRRELQVTPIRRSYLLGVQLTTTDPYQSTQQLTRLLSSFLDEKRRLIQPAGLQQMFAQQADQYKAQWQEAQRELSDFQQKEGFVSISDQEDLIQKQILATATELQTSNADVAFTKDKIHGDISQIKSTPERMTTRKTDIPDTGSVDQLNKELNDLEQRKAELLTKYRSDDRLVQQVDSEIGQAKAALDKTLNFHSAETATDINPTWQLAQQDLSESNARLSALSGRSKELEGELSDLNGKLKAIEDKAGTYNALQHRVAELDQNYQLYLQKRDEAQMANVMNEHQVLNVAVAQQPTFSSIPVSPRPLRDGVLTVGSGLLLASFVVFLVHNSKQSPHEKYLELEPVPRYPVLVNGSYPLQETIGEPSSSLQGSSSI
jgi:uncharacterized protein involved in exopolysaccharide biosynthesis